MPEIFLVIVAYCLGSIPSSVWVSQKFFGIDIRDYGSGNAGATNIFRVLGSRWGTFVMICDVLKGFIAVKLSFLLPGSLIENDIRFLNIQLLLGVAAVVGHVFPVWANFKGGKGVATLFGVVIAISPWTALACSGVFLIVLYLTRFVSLSSILAGLAFPVFILVVFNVDNHLYRVFAVAVALLIVLTHQKNIGRILRGNENKVPIFRNRDRRKQRNNNNSSS